MNPKGTTRISLIIGHPIDQVRSPELFNCRLDELGSDSVMIPADIAPERLADFARFLRGWLNVDGCVITIPHKRPMVEHLDHISDRARRLQAVNVVRRHPDGRLTGDMVDGLGFMAAATAHGFDPNGRKAAVIGAGGVGSAIADALCERGLDELAIGDVDRTRAEWLCQALGVTFPKTRIVPLAGDEFGQFDLVVNASPVGMDATEAMSVTPEAVATLRPGILVADVVTRPAMTPFLQAAERRGCKVQTGPEMAAGQMEVLGRFMQVLP